MKCGLIVNPVAGIGGEVALGGSDGVETQERARALGGQPRAFDRAERALRAITAQVPDVHFLTGAGQLGENSCLAVGLKHQVIWDGSVPSVPKNTRILAKVLSKAGADLLLFVGGDGTARDVCAAVGEDITCLGIPAGVKMHSGVFTLTPEHAAPLVRELAKHKISTEKTAVVDIDEQTRRKGQLGSRLYGYLRVPAYPPAMQRGKRSPATPEFLVTAGIAAEISQKMVPGVPCLLGPGTTVRDVAAAWGAEASLLGVDVWENGKITGLDQNAQELRAIVAGRRFYFLVSPIGGQGIILGRGNHQLNKELLEQLQPEDLFIVAGEQKLAELSSNQLLLDAPTEALNARFRGWHRVTTGYRQEAYLQLS